MNRLYMTLFISLSLTSNFAYSATPNFEGALTFTRHDIDMEVDAKSVIAIDVDSDGDIDLLTANGNDGDEDSEDSDNTITWFDNDGSENFTRKIIVTEAFAAPTSLVAIDVDEDNDIDIVSSFGGSVRSIIWFENDGEEIFSRHEIDTDALGAAAVFAIDVDGDGDIDVLSASTDDDTIAWFENDGGQNFTRQNIATDVMEAKSVFAIDVDGDTDIDVISAGSGDNTLTWFENDGDQNFTRNDIATDLSDPRSVYAVDIDGDSDVDVLSASFGDDTVAWFENDGAETFTRRDIATDEDGASSVSAVDIDGDSDLDILSTSRLGNTVNWFENDGSQGFTRMEISNGVFDARTVFPIDVDGDGDIDVIPANRASSNLVWFENSFMYQFTTEENIRDVGVVLAIDADNDEVTYSLSGVDAELFSVNFAGELTFNVAPNFEDPQDSGADNIHTILVTASANGDEVSAEITVTVTNINDAPIISGSPATMVAQGSTYTFSPTSVDEDGDELFFEIVNKPNWISFSTETGLLSGTPENFNVGVFEGIVIAVSDGNLTTSLLAFDLTVTNVNDAPTIIGTPKTTVEQNTPYTFAPNSSDPDGDTLAFSIVNKPSWVSFSTSTGLLSGTPGNSDVGITEGIEISISDGALSSSLPAFSLTVIDINDAPIISGSPDTEVAQDASYSFTPTVNDIDGDALTFSITNQPSWTSFSTVNGTLTGIPDNSDVGLVSGIVITVTDGAISASLPSFNVTVTNINDAPVISGSAATTVAQDGLYSFTPTASDIDGDEIIFDIVNKPSWATFSRTDGLLTGTPGNIDVGVTEGIVISVRDLKGDDTLIDELPAFSLTVTDTNDAPVAEGINVSVGEDSSVTIVAVISDVDEDEVLSVSLVDAPTNGTVNISGTDFFYQPNENFNGIDSFTYVANDGLLDSASATVSITVEAENDKPSAADDEYVLAKNNQGIYTLSVLNNDVDVDDDPLTIDSAESEFGQLSIAANTLLLDLGVGFVGNINLAYTMRDGAGGRDSAKVSLTINGEVDPDAPLMIIPDDLVVFATGRLSKINVGIAKAFEAQSSNSLPVKLENSNAFLAPGLHNLVWSAIDKTGLESFATQKVEVIPQISSSLNDKVGEGNIVTIEVSLNGESPTYPVIVPYTISGTAEAGIDHDGQTGELVINSGTRATLDIQVFEDSSDDDNESIIFSLSDTLNLAQNSETTITISEANLAPKVILVVEQNGVNRQVVAKDEGIVTITASVMDGNVNDTLSVTWSASEGVVSTNETIDSFTFDPASQTSSIVTISVAAADDGIPALTGIADIIVSVVDSLPELTGADKDNDRIPDNIEGYSDINANGIPNYLDAIDDCHVIPQSVNEQVLFLIEGEFGACIARGKLATQSSNGATQMTEAEVLADLIADSEAKNIGGTFDFVVNGLQVPGQSYHIVIPQLLPIPSNVVYRKYKSDQWVNFIEDESNAVYSAAGDRGVCPSPKDAIYTNGLTEGHWCVQLKIQDGGPNDMDNTANAAISDPGGVATTILNNTSPIALNDRFNVSSNISSVLAVLRNDEDANGDLLEVKFANVSFGQVSINLDNTLTYTSPTDFVGEDLITYVISDNAGGTDSATVFVNAALNHAPVAISDSATTDNETSVLINVINNDTDFEDDQLTVISVLASVGTAEVSGNDSVLYNPSAGFEGNDTLTYIVEDGNGGSSEGTVTIEVTAPIAVPTPAPAPSSSSGGGVISYTWFSLLMIIWLGRVAWFRRKTIQFGLQQN